MGKGDKKTKRGKIILGSYGVRRKRKTATVTKPELINKTQEVIAPKTKTKAVKKTKEE